MKNNEGYCQRCGRLAYLDKWDLCSVCSWETGGCKCEDHDHEEVK